MTTKIKIPIGKTLRTLRKKRDEPLRIVAAAIEVDSSLLSKIENGERLPTNQQLAKLADYFNIPLEKLTAQTIAEKIITSYASDVTTLQALKIAEEQIKYNLGNNND